MEKSGERNMGQGKKETGAQAGKPEPGKGAATFSNQERSPESIQMSKDGQPKVAGKTPFTQPATADAAVSSSSGSKGATSTDKAQGKWQQQISDAKVAWGKLTEEELLQSEGKEQQLVSLIQERYAITRDDASKQVKNFLHQHAA